MIFLQMKGSTRFAAPIFYGSCTGKHHFNDILRRGNAAHANHRNVDCLSHLIDHANSNGEDSTAGKAAHFIGNDRLFRF